MTRQSQNFEYWTGTEKTLRYTIDDGAGASIDMTGASVWWRLQDEPGSGSILLLKTGGSGITISGCTVDVLVPASLTEGCALEGTYHYDLTASGIGNTPDVLTVGIARIRRKLY